MKTQANGLGTTGSITRLWTERTTMVRLAGNSDQWFGDRGLSLSARTGSVDKNDDGVSGHEDFTVRADNFGVDAVGASH